MAKRTKKNDPQQKNKKGFDSAVLNEEFAHEIGSGKQLLERGYDNG